MLEVRIRDLPRARPVRRQGQRAPAFTLREALENPQRDVSRIVLPPAAYVQDKEKLEQRWPAAVAFIKDRKLNERFGPEDGDVGIIVQGGMYNTVMRALQYLGSPTSTATRGAALRAERHLSADRGRGRRVLLGQARRAHGRGRAARVHRAGAPHDPASPRHPDQVEGKDMLPLGGEYTAPVLVQGLERFIETLCPGAARQPAPVPNAAACWPTRGQARWPRSCRRARPGSASAAPSARSSPR